MIGKPSVSAGFTRIGSPALGVGQSEGGFLWSSYWAQRSKFWSDTFNFTTNVLTDKSGKGNHVPLVGGNCVNFINNVTITMYPAQTGATVTEVNKGAVTTGVTVSSGNIAIVAASLPETKIYQIKLNNGAELFLTGGTNFYVFCTPSIYGKLGGTEDTDWEWSTQDNFFGNLQNGFSKEALLFNLTPAAMNSASWTARNFVKTDANTVTYTGALNVNSSWFYATGITTVGKTYQIKLTVWDSTEDFEYNRVIFKYATVASIIVDDAGIALSKNGIHYVTFLHAGATHYIDLEFIDAGLDWTGRAMKFRIDYCKEYDISVLIPKSGSTDAAGNTLTHPASTTYHNGCEVKLNFSGITGVTDANGNPLVLSAAYAFGTALTNPQFKRVKYNSELKELEGDYIVFESFQNGNSLSQLLIFLEEANMLVKTNANNSVLLIQKWDDSYDRVFYFDKKGYNEYYTLQNSQLLANTSQLPIKHEYSALNQSLINDFSDNIGPYNISVIGWAGGTHLQPDSHTPAADWEEILAVSDALDTIDIGDVTDFPDPPSGKKRLVQVENWGGSAYTVGDRASYTKALLKLSLTSLRRSTTVDLSGVVIGGLHPSQAFYAYKTVDPGTPVITTSSSDWTAVKELTIAVTNTILDYSAIDKATLTGGEMITEVITHHIHQKAPTLYCDVEETFLVSKLINSHYGLQFEAASIAGGKIYLAHSSDTTMKDWVNTVDSGARATYKCEKYIMVATVANNNGINLSIFIDHDYGTPLANESTDPYFAAPAKVYFKNIANKTKAIGDKVTWRGGYNYFRNKSTTQYVLAYYQYENDSLYFIVDFTGSLAFPITEVLTTVAGRKAEITYKDTVITINGVSGTSFTIPNTGLSLTATAAGNIKLKLL